MGKDVPKEGVLVPVSPGSAIFHDRILPPLHNSYLYEESKKAFIYSSAHLINNGNLQKRYAAFREEKRKSGYTEEELHETFGFLLFEDESKANKLSDSGLLVGHSSASTIGDPSKGVYVSKYSDCLDLKRWYCGKSGHIAIVKLTKGRVKEVNENYTLNLTAPTEGFDCHESDQLKAVTPTTSSFLAFERTQHYLYELRKGRRDTEMCPRHVCPFAIVAFSYGKAEPAAPESSEKREEKTVFSYQPWKGQLVINSFTFEIGLKSSSGALLPAKLPEMLEIKNAVRVSDLRVILPKEIFETCFSGEVMVGGKCCSLFEVASTDADDKKLPILTNELKKTDIALVFHLGDSGFFVVLHSSYFLSYEDANSEKTEALQGMFVFPESRIIYKDTKINWKKSPLSSDILQVLPALNYAETEMEKAGLDQHEKMRVVLEKHFEHYGNLIHPGLQSSPAREASMFPDQYDVPPVFKHLFPMPKWTDDSSLQMKLYLGQPSSFEFPVKRAVDLIRAGQEQHRDEPEDEVYYYISSPEGPSTPSSVRLEKNEDEGLNSTAEELAVKSKGIDSSSKDLTDTSEGNDSTAKELAETLKPAESTPESKQPHISDSSNRTTEVQSEKGSHASPSMHSGVELTVTAVSTEVLKPTGTAATQKALTVSVSPLPSTHGDDHTPQISSSLDVMVKESTSDHATVASEQAADVKVSEIDTNVAVGPQTVNKVLAESKGSVPRRYGRKRKRKFPKAVPKISLKQPSESSSSPVIETKTTDGHCSETGQNQPDTELVNHIAMDAGNSKDLIEPQVNLSSKICPNTPVENSSLQFSESTKDQSSETKVPSEPSKSSNPGDDGKPDTSQRDGKEVLEEFRETTQTHPLKRKMVPSKSSNPGDDGKPDASQRDGKEVLEEFRETRQTHPLNRKMVPSKSSNPGDDGKPDASQRDGKEVLEEFRETRQTHPLNRKMVPSKSSNPGDDGEPDASQRDGTEVLEEIRETRQTHSLKRKMEKECLRADLKSIITDCGKLFVPHGREVPSKDLELAMKRQKIADGESGLKTTEEQLVSSKDAKDIASASKLSNDALVTGDLSALSCQSEQKAPNGNSSSKTKNTDGVQSTEGETKDDSSTEPQKKKKRGSEYSIISISQLRTVFRRDKKDNASAVDKVKDTASKESENSVKEDAKSDEPKCLDACQGNQDQTPSTVPATDDSRSQQATKEKEQVPRPEQKPADSEHTASDIKLGKDVNTSALVRQTSLDKPLLPKKARTARKNSAPRKWQKAGRRKVKDIPKENEHLSSETSTSLNADLLKQTLCQTASDILTGHGLEELCVSSDKSRSLEVVNSTLLPADPLTLLADLALSGSGGKNTKIAQNLGVDSRLGQKQGLQDSVKASSSAQDAASVLHALLRRSADSQKLPPKLPAPRGIVHKGDYVVLVTKDHPYSQPMLGLSGAPLQALPLSRCSDSDPHTRTQPTSSTDDRRVLHAQHIFDDKRVVKRNGLQRQPPIRKLMTSKGKEMRRSKRRQIVEKDGSIKVTRLWREQYDFRLDSKFTNEAHDKTITRALHGPWNFNIVDTPEELHLIFHMWIGLFYTKSTSRFFHIDPNLILEERECTKLPEEVVLRLPSNVPKYDGRKVPSQIQTPFGILPPKAPARLELISTKDESKNIFVPSAEALDLSVKSCSPLDLTPLNSKAREPPRTVQESLAPPKNLLESHGPSRTPQGSHGGPNISSSLREVQSQLVSASKDSLSRVFHITASSSGVKRDINLVSLHGTQTKMHGHAQENASSSTLQPSSTNTAECKTLDDWRRLRAIHNAADMQRVSYSLPPAAQTGSRASADSTEGTGQKDLNRSSQSPFSSTTTPAKPECINSSSRVESSSLDQHERASPVQTPGSLIKPVSEVPVKTSTNLSGEAAVSSPNVNASTHKIAMAVSDSIDSSVKAIKMVQNQKMLQVEAEVAIDEPCSSRGDPVSTLHVSRNSNNDTTFGQNLSDGKVELNTIGQHSQAVTGAILEVVGSKAEIRTEQQDSSSVTPSAVNDLKGLTSDSTLADDPCNQNVERAMCVEEQKESEDKITVTEKIRNDPETETFQESDSEDRLVIDESKVSKAEHQTNVCVLLSNDAAVQSVIIEQDQQKSELSASVTLQDDCKGEPCLAADKENGTIPEPSVTLMSQNDHEVLPSLTKQNKMSIHSERIVTVTSGNEFEPQPCSISQNPINPEPALPVPGLNYFEEQTQNNPNTETAVQTNNENETMTATIKDPNESNPSILVVEGEQKNTEGETQVTELCTEALSEEKISCSRSNTSIDSSKIDAPIPVEMNINLESDRSPTNSGQLADTVLEVVGEIGHQILDHVVLQKEAAVKALGQEGSQGQSKELVVTPEQDKQISQSSNVTVEHARGASIADIPYVVEEKPTKESMLPSRAKEEMETDIRCPTPTVDEMPYISTASDKIYLTMDTRITSQCSTPTQDELPPDGEGSFPVVSSTLPDRDVLNPEVPDIAALSQMISWFRNEQKKKELNAMASRNLGLPQFKWPNPDQSDRESHWNSPGQFRSNEGLQNISSELNAQNTQSYHIQYGDLTDLKADGMTLYPQSTHSVSEKHGLAMYASESGLNPTYPNSNLPYWSYSKNVAHESCQPLSEADSVKNRMEVQPDQERERFDTTSASTVMRDEWGYWEEMCSEQANSSEKHQWRYLEYGGINRHTKKKKKEKVHETSSSSSDTSSDSDSSSSSDTSSSSSEQKSLDESHKRYKKGERLRVTVEVKREHLNVSGLRPEPVLPVLDRNKPRIIPVMKPKIGMHSRTIQNTYHKGTHRYVEKFLQKWNDLHQTEDDVTQSSMDFEYLVFSEKMSDILKRSRPNEPQKLITASKPPVTIQFSSLNEQETSEEIGENLPMLSDYQIQVTLPGRQEEQEEDSGPIRLPKLACKRENEIACSKISAITAECANSYYAMMNEICTSKNPTIRPIERTRKEQSSPKPRPSKTDGLCGRMKEDLFERLHDNLNSVVRQACKTKYRFYVLVTSEDPFFKKTKHLLENEGHICVEPEEFDLGNTRPPSPLLIILRNEDIAMHVCQVPHLLELKKSPSVLFAGIDQPDDFVNLTHQELFGKGGFVVIDGSGVNKLTLESMKKIVMCLEQLSKKGKWKWFLHYRDSRMFKENARSHEDVQDRKYFLDCCQEAGIVEVLPYHECDVISRDQPNYLHCLVQLQVQNATTRFPVFVTDTPDRSFGKNGILTMNMSTFTQILSNDSCTIS